MDKESEVAKFIRQKRMETGLSLRALAQQLEVTHVFVSELERGVRRVPEGQVVPLCRALNISADELKRHDVKDRPLQIPMTDAPPKYQDLGLALARRIEKRDLRPKEISELLRILGER